ncbi:MAG TPA: hypothetical protein VGM88_27675 [Kofleriaceae bacterium]|jgi:hypothetical protein
MTPFGAILQKAVEGTPGAVGGAFADPQGEMVDAFAAGYDPHEWAVLTAHFGVIFAQLQSLFGTWHFGGAEYFIAQHARLGVIVHVVDRGYFALFAVSAPNPIAHALIAAQTAARALYQEMQ